MKPGSLFDSGIISDQTTPSTSFFTRNASTLLSVSKPADEALVLDTLTGEQCHRLSEILDTYLQALEAGRPLNLDEIVARNPDLVEAIQYQVKGLHQLHNVLRGNIAYCPAVLSTPPNVRTESFTGRAANKIGDYELIREIGRGGMGVVYEAKDLSLDRTVAVKLLPLSVAADPIAAKRFQNEARTAAQLEHPNIVAVIAAGCDGITPYYAMPFVAGSTLGQLIQHYRNQFLGPEVSEQSSSAQTQVWQDAKGNDPFLNERTTLAIHLGIQICEALAYAHEIGVVHRDVKPSNILITPANQALLTDFGLAKCTQNESLTHAGDLLGTFKYMSPEQATGNAALLDQRSDIYSLAASLIELITLNRAETDTDRVALSRKIAERQTVAVASLHPNLPKDLRTVFEKALSFALEDRYQTAADFAEDLKRLQTGQHPKAKPITPLERCSRFVSCHAILLLSATAAVTLLAISFATLAIFAKRETIRAELYLQTSQENYRSLRKTVDKLADLTDQLRGVPGTASIREQAAQETLSHYLQFIQQSEDTSPFLLDLGRAYCRVGELQTKQGQYPDALRATSNAIETVKVLINSKDSKQLASARRILGVAENNRATIHMRLEEWDSALVSLEQAEKHQLSALSKFDSMQPAEADALRLELAITLQHLSRALLIDGRQNESISRAKHAYQTLQEVSSQVTKENDLCRRTRVMVCSWLAELLVKAEPDFAHNLFREAVSNTVELARNGSLDDRSLAAATFDAYAGFLHQVGTDQAALRQSDQAIEILRLLAASSAEVRHQRSLAKALGNRAAILLRRDEGRRAQSDLEEALQLAQQQDDQFLQASLMCNLGSLHRTLLDDAKAEKLMQEAWTSCQSAMVQAPLSYEQYEQATAIGQAVATFLRKTGKQSLAKQILLDLQKAAPAKLSDQESRRIGAIKGDWNAT